MTYHEGTDGGSGLAVPVLDPSAKGVGCQRHAPPSPYPMRKRPGTRVLAVEWASKSCWKGTEILAPPQDFANRLPYPGRHSVSVALLMVFAKLV